MVSRSFLGRQQKCCDSMNATRDRMSEYLSLSLSECMCVLNVIAPDVHLYTRYSLHIRDDRNVLVSQHGFSESFSGQNVCSTIWPSLHSSYVAVDTVRDLTTTKTTMMMTWHTISLFIICVRKKSIQSTPRLPRHERGRERELKLRSVRIVENSGK